MSGLLYADVTQSWSEKGGGIRVYLNRKRRFIIERTEDRHLLVIPGAADSVEQEGRAITVTVRSPRVPGSPNYRLMLRNGEVHAALERFAPDLIECQDAYNLPWAALKYRDEHPATALVASFMTDFPTAYTKRAGDWVAGRWIGNAAARIAYRYLANLYRRFDAVVALSEHGGADKLRSIGVDHVFVAPLGVDVEEFSKARRDEALRAEAGCVGDSPLLIYVGRLDGEKRAATVVEAFGRLPAALGARLVLVGDGLLREKFAAMVGVHCAGFIRSRAAGAVAGERGRLCVGDGRRDVRDFGDRGASGGLAGGGRRGGGDDRPRAGGAGAARAGRRSAGDGGEYRRAAG